MLLSVDEYYYILALYFYMLQCIEKEVCLKFFLRNSDHYLRKIPKNKILKKIKTDS